MEKKKKNKNTVPIQETETVAIIEKSSSFEKVSVQLRTDAFTALVHSMLNEPFMSSTTKSLILSSMIGTLEEKYSTEEMNTFKLAMQKIINKFLTTNSFMG